MGNDVGDLLGFIRMVRGEFDYPVRGRFGLFFVLSLFFDIQ